MSMASAWKASTDTDGAPPFGRFEPDRDLRQVLDGGGRGVPAAGATFAGQARRKQKRHEHPPHPDGAARKVEKATLGGEGGHQIFRQPKIICRFAALR